MLAFFRRLAPEGECLVWTGYLSTDGYGVARFDGRPMHAHRIAYELAFGPIPVGAHVDHLCRNRACVNPDHLEAVSIAENVLRGSSPAAANARKTHCKRGHEFTPENTYVQPGTVNRVCRICLRERRIEWERRNPEKARASWQRAHAKWRKRQRARLSEYAAQTGATPTRRGKGIRLKAEEVREIRQLYASGLVVPEIAIRFGITKPTVYRVVRRESYPDVA